MTLAEEGGQWSGVCVCVCGGGAGEKQGKKMDEQPEGTLG